MSGKLLPAGGENTQEAMIGELTGKDNKTKRVAALGGKLELIDQPVVLSFPEDAPKIGAT